jgi:MSHA biogenesis protein MshG
MLREKRAFAAGMAQSISAGLPLQRVLVELLAQIPTLKKVASNVISRLAGGSSLAEALNHATPFLSDVDFALIQIGESTGRLDTTFFEIAKTAEQDLERRRVIDAALRHPTTHAWVGLFIYSCAVYAASNVASAAAGRFLFAGSIMFLLLVGCASLKRLLMPGGATLSAFSSNIIFRIPWFGSSISKFCWARASRFWANTERAGIPTQQALKFARDVSGSLKIANCFRDALEATNRGAFPSEGMHSNGSAPTSLIQIVRTGESTGRLPELLTSWASTTEDEALYSLAQGGKVLGASAQILTGIFVAASLV